MQLNLNVPDEDSEKPGQGNETQDSKVLQMRVQVRHMLLSELFEDTYTEIAEKNS